MSSKLYPVYELVLDIDGVTRGRNGLLSLRSFDQKVGGKLVPVSTTIRVFDSISLKYVWMCVNHHMFGRLKEEAYVLRGVGWRGTRSPRLIDNPEGGPPPSIHLLDRTTCSAVHVHLNELGWDMRSMGQDGYEALWNFVGEFGASTGLNPVASVSVYSHYKGGLVDEVLKLNATGTGVMRKYDTRWVNVSSAH